VDLVAEEEKGKRKGRKGGNSGKAQKEAKKFDESKKTAKDS